MAYRDRELEYRNLGVDFIYGYPEEFGPHVILDLNDTVVGGVDLNITEINPTYDDQSAYSDADNDISVLGNTLHGSVSFGVDGDVIEVGVGDVSWAADEYGYK